MHKRGSSWRLHLAIFVWAWVSYERGALAQMPVIAAAGDIACDPNDGSFNGGAGTATACRMGATAALLATGGYSAVLLLGDNQYVDGTLAKYQASYAPSWGTQFAITYPVPGNHEYLTPGAAGYYSYFGARAHDPTKGYYSYNLGGWHLIALNSNCGDVGGCGAGSPQEQWLASDLAANPGVCTLAYWHHPRFSSGPHGDDATYVALWNTLYSAGADVVLVGHDHIYERFSPQDPNGLADPARGLRQFVVGTGGSNLTSIVTVRANSEVRSASAFGVLALTLYPNGYDWQFRPIAGNVLNDSGTSLCQHARLPKASKYYTVTPCRLADTRGSGPALLAGESRPFAVAGLCGVPSTARAVSLNVAAVSPTAAGDLAVFAHGGLAMGTSTVSLKANRTRATATISALGVGGKVTVQSNMSSGSTHLVLDVAGYFE